MAMIKLIKSLFFVVVITGSLSSQAGDLTAQTSALGGITEYSETILINAIEKIKNQRIDEALSDLEELVNINPKFSLAQLIYADLLTAKSNKVTDFGNFYNAPYDQIDALRNEAKARWDYHKSRTDQNKIPVSLVQMAENQEYAIVVDLSISRLFLFSNYNGVPKLIKDFYVSTGKNGIGKLEEGDQKTPIGVYFVTDFIDPEELPDLYGDGAFPINYPNVVDKRFGRTGYGIWLHGTRSATYSRPPRDSDGCIVLTNQDFNFISKYIELGTTPVVLAEKIEWTAIDDWKKRRQQSVQYIEQWRKDWESRDADR